MGFLWAQHCAVRAGHVADLAWRPSLARVVCAAPSCLQYKFIVDGDWKHDPNQRAMHDENGNVNNVIEVQEYVPENLENISGFDPPPSPSARCAGAQRAHCCSIEHVRTEGTSPGGSAALCMCGWSAATPLISSLGCCADKSYASVCVAGALLPLLWPPAAATTTPTRWRRTMQRSHL